MVLSESGIDFVFPRDCICLKFDGTDFYRDHFDKFPGAKGVDFLISNKKRLSFIEVKNCLGDEANNRWRIARDNSKRGTAATSINNSNGVSDRDSVDIEVAQKVAMSIACLNGAYRFLPSNNEVSAFAANELPLLKNRDIFVILFLEGDFGSRTRSKKTIMLELEHSIQKKLNGWLRCSVSVVDSTTCRGYGVSGKVQ